MASTVSFNNISYHVPVKGCFSKKEKKQILFDISGIFKPGLNAILGPAGSGKTTLLNILAGRIDKDGLEGMVLVDGKKQPKDFNSISGYVVQDDLIMGTLTVQENVKFSADLRLPKSVNSEERKKKVEEVIEELGLVKCSKSKIGTEFIRGVSGGERKRTAIAMELITSPLVLFVDEPTTGLDASTATSVITTLKRLSEKGNTVIFSIHQPRYAIYRLFDSLMLLSGGRTIYHGPASQALNHFSSIGYECEKYNNPSDFFLDVIIENEKKDGDQDENNLEKKKLRKIINAKKLNHPHNQQDNNNHYNINTRTNNHTNNHTDNHTDNNNNHVILQSYVNKCYTEIDMPDNKQQQLHNHYQSSLYNRQLKIDLEGIVKGDDNNGWNISRGYKTGFFKQLYYVAKRALINSMRNPGAFLLQVATTIFKAVLVGVLYRAVSNNIEESAIYNRIGAIFFILVTQMYFSVSSLSIFIVEKSIFIHESSAGYYRVSAFFISKVLCDIIPLRLILCFINSIIIYFMIGFQMTAGKFFFFFLILFLVTLAATAFIILISIKMRNVSVAQIITTQCYILFVLFGGVYVTLGTIDDWLRWLMHISMIRYGVTAMVINEFEGLVIYNNGTEATELVKQEMLRMGVELGSSWSMWENIVALICIIIILLILSYISLRRISKHK